MLLVALCLLRDRVDPKEMVQVLLNKGTRIVLISENMKEVVVVVDQQCGD